MTTADIPRKIALAAIVAAGLMAAGCLNGIKVSDYRRSDVGELTRVEAAVLVSQRWVTLSSWWPFGLGPGGPVRSQGDVVSQQRRGIQYVVRLERTGETLAVTQADDVMIANGAQVWVELGDRVRVFPR